MSEPNQDGIWRLDRIFSLCSDHDKLVIFLQSEGLLGNHQGICPKCQIGTVNLRLDKSKTDGKIWRCGRSKHCNYKLSIRHGSFFSQTHLALETVLKLIYFWVWKVPQDFMRHELDLGSHSTSTDWNQFCRDVCGEILISDTKDGIGGPGHTIEIDESKFGKRKYNKGKKVEGQWVFGGIDRDTKDLFLVPCMNNKRDKDTLLPLIYTYIKPGSTVISDCWKAYFELTRNPEYDHLTVNHSIEFVNSDTGAHTNTIESTWRAVKASLPKYGAQKHLYQSYFLEYCCRKKYLNQEPDKFAAFLKLIKRVYPLKALEVHCSPRKSPLKRAAPTPSTTVHTPVVRKLSRVEDSFEDFE